MADMDDELDSLFDDSSLDDGDINDFLKMMDNEDAANIFSDDDDDSSFVSADLDADENIDSSFGVMEDWDKVSNTSSGEAAQKKGSSSAQNVDEGSFTDIDNLLTGIDENAEVPEPLQKVSFWQKIKSIFKKKELTEEQRLAKEAEEAEEAEYEQRLSAEKEEKKKVKAEAKASAREEAEKKKQANKEAKAANAAKAAAKKAEAQKKKQEKAAKKAEAAGGPIPKSQLVPVAPLAVFIIIGIALSVVVVLGCNTRFYSANVKDAKELFVHQQYSKAYKNLLGLEIKEKDQEFYDQVEVVNLLSDKLDSYNSYMAIDRYEEALDSLLVGVRKYNENVQRAKELGLIVEFQGIYDEIIVHLRDKFGIEPDQVNSMLTVTYSEYKKNITTIAGDAAVADGVRRPVKAEDETEND